MSRTALHIAVVGAGPVGLALALQTARALPQAELTLFDARPIDRDVSADPRTLALALGSVQWLRQLGGWPEAACEPITVVHVSQSTPSLLNLLPWPGPRRSAEAAPAVELRAAAMGVPRLGAVLSYGALVAALQQAWAQAAAAAPQRLRTRFGAPVAALKGVGGGVEVDAGIAERFDLAVVAEGGVFAEQQARSVTRDYAQTAWVGSVVLEGGTRGMAFERFTPQGPAALLPLPPAADGRLRAALVWCVSTAADPVAPLSEPQRAAVLNTLFPAAAGRIAEVSAFKPFALGLNAAPRLRDAATGGRVLRIGNAAQTLHPVAGQGLNLGLRDAQGLVAALRRGADGPGGLDAALTAFERGRAPDRWTMIGATDLLARGFTWGFPGAATARAAALAALQALPPLRGALARQMMFGWR
jgi:2-octaprenyl-6-methoxyphenol hydroxylase